uniref:Uncharacterized protein n=1 Tax=Schizaphis graminum TaxID=13262 RepID=A0A2S2PN67_SCHGA
MKKQINMFKIYKGPCTMAFYLGFISGIQYSLQYIRPPKSEKSSEKPDINCTCKCENNINITEKADPMMSSKTYAAMSGFGYWMGFISGIKFATEFICPPKIENTKPDINVTCKCETKNIINEKTDKYV